MAAAESHDLCRIYLAVPAGMDNARLPALIEIRQVASLLLYADSGAPPAAGTARQVLAAAHSKGIPLIIADDPALAKRIGADGVHIPANEQRYALCRDLLGEDAIIGAGCVTSRHDALVLAERGADYVAFGPEPGRPEDGGDIAEIAELLGWWQELCEPPVVGWHHGSWDDAAALIGAGADFLGVSGLITGADDPATALDRLGRLVAEQTPRKRGNET